MLKIRTYNQISVKGLVCFPRNSYEVASELPHPDAILLRSHKLLHEALPCKLKAIARAGAGINNVPVESCTQQGVVVFNTPGANANAVKELVLTALLLSSRGIVEGINFVSGLSQASDVTELGKYLEQQKKNFKGTEIKGKTLGVVGLGAIGANIAATALQLGMKVIGYDPAISVEAAWRLPAQVQRMESLASLLAKADFITLHVPFLPQTRHMISTDSLSSVKKGAVLLNFAREEIVDPYAIARALGTGRLSKYTTDFPHPELLGRSDVLMMPHIGASTEEAEDNCAVMAVEQLKDFLENGNISNSVNFPAITLERSSGHRITFANHNVSGVLGHVLSVLATHQVNVLDMINKSKNQIAYNIIDIEQPADKQLMSEIHQVEHVINARYISN